MSQTVHELRVLLGLRLTLLLRAAVTRYTRSSRLAGPVRLLVFALIALWLVGTAALPLTFGLSHAFHGAAGRRMLGPSLAWGLSATVLLIFFYGVLNLVGSLTYRSDLKLLLLTPLSPRLLLGTKVLSVALGFSPVLLLGLPGLLAAGIGLHLGPAYVIVLFALLVILPVAPVSLALLLVLAVLHWLPPARARTISTILGVLLGATFFIASQLWFGSRSRVSLTAAAPSLPAWVPSGWPGWGLATAGLGEPRQAALYLLGTVALAAGLFAVAVSLSARLFATGAATYQEVGSRQRSKRMRPVSLHGEPIDQDIAGGRDTAQTRSATRLAWLPLLGKEWTTLRRDPQQLATMIYPLILIGFYLYRLFSRHSLLSVGTASSSTFTAGSLYVIAAFAAILIAGTIGATAVNREGRSIYLLALAPLSARELFAAKWSFALLPPLLVAECILAAGSAILQITVIQAAVAGAVLALLVIALSGMAIVVNLLWPRLNWDNPRRQASGIATVAGFGIELATGGIAITLLIVAIVLWPTHPSISILLVGSLVIVIGGLVGGVALAGPRLLANLLSSDARPR